MQSGADPRQGLDGLSESEALTSHRKGAAVTLPDVLVPTYVQMLRLW
jgi:hypothetical protein